MATELWTPRSRHHRRHEHDCSHTSGSSHSCRQSLRPYAENSGVPRLRLTIINNGDLADIKLMSSVHSPFLLGRQFRLDFADGMYTSSPRWHKDRARDHTLRRLGMQFKRPLQIVKVSERDPGVIIVKSPTTLLTLCRHLPHHS